MRKRLARLLSRFVGEERATASVEFVLTVPVLMLIFMSSFESGLLMTRQIILEQALDEVMRDLRLGKVPNPSAKAIKNRICAKSIIFTDCAASTSVELTPVNVNTWALPNARAACSDREEEVEPVITFIPGAENEMMMVRVCVVQDAMFPTTGLGADLPLDSQGGYGLIAVSAFVNEPK